VHGSALTSFLLAISSSFTSCARAIPPFPACTPSSATRSNVQRELLGRLRDLSNLGSSELTLSFPSRALFPPLSRPPHLSLPPPSCTPPQLKKSSPELEMKLETPILKRKERKEGRPNSKSAQLNEGSSSIGCLVLLLLLLTGD